MFKCFFEVHAMEYSPTKILKVLGCPNSQEFVSDTSGGFHASSPKIITTVTCESDTVSDSLKM